MYFYHDISKDMFWLDIGQGKIEPVVDLCPECEIEAAIEGVKSDNSWIEFVPCERCMEQLEMTEEAIEDFTIQNLYPCP